MCEMNKMQWEKKILEDKCGKSYKKEVKMRAENNDYEQREGNIEKKKTPERLK